MKKFGLIAGMLATVMITGCASVYNIETEESDKIAEYAAGVITKYSYVNVDDYMELREYLAKEAVATEPATTTPVVEVDNPTIEIVDPAAGIEQSTGPSEVQPEDNGSIGQTLGMEGIAVEYKEYFLTDSYPKEDFMISQTAPAGYKLLIVRWNLANTSSEQVTINVKEGVAVRAVINGSNLVKVFKTALNDDILNMNGKQLVANEVIEGVLVFCVKDEQCENITSLEIIAQ